jgi:hypothetical protein
MMTPAAVAEMERLQRGQRTSLDQPSATEEAIAA